ncbi:hypothetical protein GV828_00615 [Flavobacterium sp. NST-5]|uniref:Uncharacterized protein n=1 Tax=Flavobacterium ichthyis TaxID=2698827 RepID=A0ABW9Z6E5_9FLAO|nr:hypothetical protein [Flavobacterium ichthyis]NBL63695.1 hypothetical protein [Flavobacterium ichthyis]
MKKIVLTFALFMLFKPVLPVLEYIAFYDYIKNELCENKAKPEMHCNGKCHLAKELAKANDSEKSQDARFFSVEIFAAVFPEIPVFTSSPFLLSSTEKATFGYQNLYFHLASSKTFHPPLTV